MVIDMKDRKWRLAFSAWKWQLTDPTSPKPDHPLSANISHLGELNRSTLAHLLLLSDAGPKLVPLLIRMRRCLMGRRLKKGVIRRKPYFAADLVTVMAVQIWRILETLVTLKLLPSRPE